MKFVTSHPEGFLLTVTVQPRASRNQVVGIHDDSLKIKLTAPPVDNAANKMCIQCVHFELDVFKDDPKKSEMNCAMEHWGSGWNEIDDLAEIREQMLTAMGCDDFEIAELE